MKAFFLDFDGVVVDSIKETFVVSTDVYYGFSSRIDSELMENLFYKHRGLVGPPYQFLLLHRSIEKSLIEQTDMVEDVFKELELSVPQDERDNFVSGFMARRKEYQKDLDFWLSMNPLTPFGSHLKTVAPADCYIVTTKNREATDLLIRHHSLVIAGVFAKSEFEECGNKGKIITQFLDANTQYESAVFVDDHTSHLNDVSGDSRVKCFFADWGYGGNTDYPVFNKWDLG